MGGLPGAHDRHRVRAQAPEARIGEAGLGLMRREFGALTRLRHPAMGLRFASWASPCGSPHTRWEYVPGLAADRALARGDWASLFFVAAQVAHGLRRALRRRASTRRSPAVKSWSSPARRRGARSASVCSTSVWRGPGRDDQSIAALPATPPRVVRGDRALSRRPAGPWAARPSRSQPDTAVRGRAPSLDAPTPAGGPAAGSASGGGRRRWVRCCGCSRPIPLQRPSTRARCAASGADPSAARGAEARPATVVVVGLSASWPASAVDAIRGGAAARCASSRWGSGKSAARRLRGAALDGPRGTARGRRVRGRRRRGAGVDPPLGRPGGGRRGRWPREPAVRPPRSPSGEVAPQRSVSNAGRRGAAAWTAASDGAMRASRALGDSEGLDPLSLAPSSAGW
jgi:hypothetical protein